jgi:ParB family chromosome partitioning protein
MNMKRLEQYDVYDIPVEKIYYDSSFNCRGAFTLESIRDLSESIRQIGLNFPVTVQPAGDIEGGLPDGREYRLIAGHRRFKAVMLFLSWQTVPASIRHGLSERDARLINFAENLERSDLNILEEAKAIRNLYPNGVSLREAARELKRPTRWVHIRLRLLQLPEEIQAKASAGLLSAVNLETILAIEDPEEQLKAANEIGRVRERGKTKSLAHLDPAYCRSFRYRRTKDQIRKVITRMLDLGIGGLPPRALAWAAGYVRDDELEQDIQQEVEKRTSDGTQSPQSE